MFTLFRIPVFRRLWAAITLSSLGDWLGLLANTALAQQLTRGESLATQGTAISGVILVRLLPDLLLGPIAGALADRLDRRKTVIIGEVAAALLYLSIAFAYDLRWLYIAQFMIEAVGLFTFPAKQAIWVNIVPRERLAVANQLSLMSVYGSVPIAAAIFALLSTINRFFEPPSTEPIVGDVHLAIVIALTFNAATFLLSAFTVFVIRKSIPTYLGDRAPGKNVFALVFEGVKFVRSHPVLRVLYVGILGAFCAGGLTAGVAQLYVGTLEAGTAGYSIIFGTVFGGLAVGMVAGPRVLPTVSRRRIFGVAICLAGAALLALALARDFILSVALTGVVGCFAGIAWIIGYTLIGHEVDDQLRGRVFAFVFSSVRIMLLLTVAAGPALAGLLGPHRVQLGGVGMTLTGPALTLLIGGLLALAVGIYASRQVKGYGQTRLLDALRRRLHQPDLLAEQRLDTGLFVVFEGPDLVRTATGARQLGEALRAEGYVVVVTGEPSDTPPGRQVRELLAAGTHPSTAEASPSDVLAPETAVLLSAADRAEHVARVVRPALDRGQIVISDRYVDSSLAFHGGGRGADMGRIWRTSMWGTGGLLPNLTIVIDPRPAPGESAGGDRAAGNGAADEDAAATTAEPTALDGDRLGDAAAPDAPTPDGALPASELPASELPAADDELGAIGPDRADSADSADTDIPVDPDIAAGPVVDTPDPADPAEPSNTADDTSGAAAIRRAFLDQADAAPDRYLVISPRADTEELPEVVLTRVRRLLADRSTQVSRRSAARAGRTARTHR